MSASLVGSEMCIRDSVWSRRRQFQRVLTIPMAVEHSGARECEHTCGARSMYSVALQPPRT
eukprot:13253565-Alexandrium_andersonii.AAC.1